MRYCLASDLSRYARAPASSSSPTRTSLSCMVKINTSAVGTRARIWRVASSVHHGQRVVDDRDVGAGFDRLGDCFLSVASFGNHLPALMRFEDCTQAEANHLVVVGNEDAGHRRPLRAKPFWCSAIVELGSIIVHNKEPSAYSYHGKPLNAAGKPGELRRGGPTAGQAV